MESSLDEVDAEHGEGSGHQRWCGKGERQGEGQGKGAWGTTTCTDLEPPPPSSKQIAWGWEKLCDVWVLAEALWQHSSHAF